MIRAGPALSSDARRVLLNHRFTLSPFVHVLRQNVYFGDGVPVFISVAAGTLFDLHIPRVSPFTSRFYLFTTPARCMAWDIPIALSSPDFSLFSLYSNFAFLILR